MNCDIVTFYVSFLVKFCEFLGANFENSIAYENPTVISSSELPIMFGCCEMREEELSLIFSFELVGALN